MAHFGKGHHSPTSMAGERRNRQIDAPFDFARIDEDITCDECRIRIVEPCLNPGIERTCDLQ